MDEQVNIPALLLVSDGRTWIEKSSEIWLCSLTAIWMALGKSGAKFQKLARGMTLVMPIRTIDSPRKVSRVKLIVSVPQTNTGRRGE